MPAFTFMFDNEKNIPTSNNELNVLLKAVREKTGEDWQLLERSVKRHIWGKEEKIFMLLVGIPCCDGSIIEYQIINFYRENTGTSINEYVPAELIAAYFFGALS
jgi:hypothetical protein